jgi:hypothetical protein
LTQVSLTYWTCTPSYKYSIKENIYWKYSILTKELLTEQQFEIKKYLVHDEKELYMDSIFIIDPRLRED